MNQLSVPEEVKIRDKLVDDTFEHNSPPVEAEEIIIEEPEVVPTEAQVHSPVPPEEDIAMAPAQAEPIQPSAPPEPEPEPEPESAPTPSEPPTRLEGKHIMSDDQCQAFRFCLFRQAESVGYGRKYFRYPARKQTASGRVRGCGRRGRWYLTTT